MSSNIMENVVIVETSENEIGYIKIDCLNGHYYTIFKAG